jgi:hypothetical protein
LPVGACSFQKWNVDVIVKKTVCKEMATMKINIGSRCSTPSPLAEEEQTQ